MAIKVKGLLLNNLVFFGLLLSAWAIFSIEIKYFPTIPLIISTNNADDWNRFFLSLAYSYIAGVIVYWLTVKLPYLRNKKHLHPIIQIKIKNIGVHLMNMNLEFRVSGNNNPDISDVDSVMALFTTKRWREKCKWAEHYNCRNVTEGYMIDYYELQQIVGSLINDYKEYLTTDQLQLLEILRGRKVDQFFTSIKRGNHNYEFSDYFYEKLLQPSYRQMLEAYNRLADQ